MNHISPSALYMSDGEFDAIFGRLKAAGIPHRAAIDAQRISRRARIVEEEDCASGPNHPLEILGVGQQAGENAGDKV